MNKTIQRLTRDEIKKGLKTLPVEQQVFFKRIYTGIEFPGTMEDVVDCVPVNQLDNALCLVERTIFNIDKPKSKC